MIRSGFCKFFADGVVESKTAALLDSYEGDPSNHGTLLWTKENYHAAVSLCDKLGTNT